MKNLKEISVLDRQDIMEAIFEKKLETISVKNNFNYSPGQGYYEENKVSLNIGFRFLTPTGKLSKIYPVVHINLKEEGTKSGETNWISKEETLTLLKKKVSYYVNSPKDYMDRFKVRQRGNLAQIVVSTGSGGIEVFLLKEVNIAH